MEKKMAKISLKRLGHLYFVHFIFGNRLLEDSLEVITWHFPHDIDHILMRTTVNIVSSAVIALQLANILIHGNGCLLLLF
jgi:hypothetical protein